MSIDHNRKKSIASALGAAVAAAAAASGIAIPLAAMILAAPANADTHHGGGFVPPDPCTTATSCPNMHMQAALNPQPLPPGRALNPQPLPPGFI